MESYEEASTSKFLVYGMPRLSAGIVLDIIDFGILFLYITAYGLPPILAGIATAIGKLSIAAGQFLMGWLSDSIDTKYGRRKPFMFFYAPLLALSFTMALLPMLVLQNPTIMLLFIWILSWDAIFQFTYGGLTTPYQSWVAEQFQVDKRPKASAFQNLFSFIGTGVGVVFTLLVFPPLIESFLKTRTIDPTFIVLVIFFAILAIALFYACAIILPVEKIEGAEMNFIQDLKKVVKDKNFMKVCWLQAIAFLALGMITPTILGFATVVLKFEGTTLYLAAVSLLVGIMIFLFMWKKLIDKKGKKPTFMIILLTGVIILPFSLIGLIPNVSFIFGIIFVLGIAAFLGGWYLFPYIWFADLAEDYEQRSGEARKAGLYAGFPQILLNIFQAMALFVTGFILSLPNVPGRDFSWGYIVWGLWCSGIILIAYLFTRKLITLDFEWEKESA
ncbi:MAG: MFS transporter [Candidatus Lokiarchaeota archaeon]|nr:MFS transporter [Candidatus Lokiarchaeota archaeon]MBD3338223.1 MFS transporter [Candidatus Lokiarchaeota archaeon]